jgi:ATP phosphoribosyltransferase
MKGAVELAPSIGIADSVCDLVSSGATLEANGLKVFKTILDSEAVLIQSKRLLTPEKELLLKKVLRRIDGVIKSSETKYVMLNAPREKVDKITELLPGSDSPTIVPLAGRDNLVALQAVCTEKILWENLEDLKSLGARAILVLPIEKMMS